MELGMCINVTVMLNKPTSTSSMVEVVLKAHKDCFGIPYFFRMEDKERHLYHNMWY